MSVVSEMREYQVTDTESEQNNEEAEIKPTIIEYLAPDAEYVDIAGTLTDWKPVRMESAGNGLWRHEVSKSGKHLFKFIVDNVWITSDKYPIEGEDANNMIQVANQNQKVYKDMRGIRAMLSAVHQE